MKRMEDIKKELRGLVAAHLPDAVQRLKELVSVDSSIYRDVLLQEARLTDTEQAAMKGLVTDDVRAVTYNRVCQAILFLIEDLVPECLNVDSHAVFDIRMPQYKLDLMRLDRREAKSRFDEQFVRLQTADAQHYVIIGERHQQPRTFVERLVFELENRGLSLNYEQEGENHIRLIHLEPGSDAEGARLFFRQYLSDRFHCDLDRLADLKTVFPPSDRYDYIIAVFEFAGVWKSHTRDLLHWIITEFCQPPPPLPTRFLFFYIVDGDLQKRSPGLLHFLSGQKSTRQLIRKTVLELDQLPNCTCIPELQPIPREELITWLHEFVSNEEEVDKLIEELLRPLNDGQDKQRLNMSFLERRLMEYIT